MTRSSSLVIVAAISIIFLSGCSTTTQPAPDSVMTEVSQQLANLSSAEYHLNLSLKGSIPSSLGNLDAADINLTGEFVGADTTLPNYSVLADITGLKGGTNVHLSGQMIGLTDFTYFQLTELSLPSLLPVSLGVDKKWYKVQTGDVGKSADVSIDSDKVTSVQEIIGGSHPFEVTEVLPITTVNGVRAFHYKTQINPTELTSVISKLNQTLGTTATTPSVEYLGDYQPEIFISAQTHQLLEIKTSGLYLKDNLPISFDLDLNFSHLNKAPDLNPPSVSENLDSDKLFKLPKLPF